MDEENKILEGETFEVVEETEKAPRKKRKMDFYVELVLFLILGILIGVAVKNEAAKRLVIGYDDYKMKIARQDYDINKLQAEVIEKNAEAQKQSEENVEDLNEEAPAVQE
ncbi:MAG: hypothetical protein QG620_336 [Patescibacteria group bacterium]|nr:hypothetical protein [Patescibacteria group bacterium]